MKNKVVLIGTGNVGMSYAFALVNQRTKVEELVLIDSNQSKAEGEALDLNHALSYAPTKMIIKSGNYTDCNDAKIIVICAGRNQEVGETRLDLLNKNLEVFRSIISEIKQTNFDGIYIIATNPVDIMAFITLHLTNTSPEKVIGSGTTLDTARLRYLVSQKLSLNVKNVHAYVVGEHGDSEFALWSLANVGGINIDGYLSKSQKNSIAEEVKNSAYNIISKKGNTSYGIGMCLVGITNSILDNLSGIFTISAYDPKNKIYYGFPSIINEQGVKERLSVPFNDEETSALENSISVIKSEISKLKI